MTNPNDLRKATRVRTDLPMTAKRARQEMFEARVVNLSEGGAFLETKKKVIAGEELMLFLTLEIDKAKKSCMVQGRVAWSNQQPKKGALGCGVAFGELAPAMARLIQQYVSQKLEPEEVKAEVTTADPKSPKAPGRGQLRG